MRIIAYSSGAWPCGIADYHGKLTREFPASVHCDTTTLPTDTVHRDHPLKLWERRRHYAKLAARSQAYDASLIQFITHWNGNRDWEYTLPVFVKHLIGPFAVILHEWPPLPNSELSGTSAPRRLVARTNKQWDREGLDHDEWLNRRFLGRAGHIFVHSEALRDRTIAAGIPGERVTFSIHPVANLPIDESSAADAIKARYPGRRFIVIFGFPHPRKSLELAIQALPGLPPDVMLLFVGGVDGSFRQQYVQSLLQLAKRLGVHDRTVFVGEVPEQSLRAVFQSAQFALAPFAYATGSGSFAYLMSAGVPIVASDLPEHHMLQREGAGVELFETGNVSALASAVDGLLNDGKQRESLSIKSRAFVNRHSFASFADTVAARLRALSAAR